MLRISTDNWRLIFKPGYSRLTLESLRTVETGEEVEVEALRIPNSESVLQIINEN